VFKNNRTAAYQVLDTFWSNHCFSQRSISETGATLAVATHLQTTPVLIVTWVNSLRGTSKPIVGVTSLTVGLACGFLILFSLVNPVCVEAFNKKREEVKMATNKINNVFGEESQLMLI